MSIAVGIACAILAGILLFVLLAEIQTTICLVVNRGGLWAAYSTGIGRVRLVGFQVRVMLGHKPRAWVKVPFRLHPISADYRKTVRSAFEPKWKPLQIPIKSALDIGANLTIKELTVRARLGLEDDAVATALLCGGANAVLHAARAAITRGKYAPKGTIAVSPSFSKTRLSIYAKCILAIKARHIIWEIAQSILRRQKNGQSSD